MGEKEDWDNNSQQLSWFNSSYRHKTECSSARDSCDNLCRIVQDQLQNCWKTMLGSKWHIHISLKEHIPAAFTQGRLYKLDFEITEKPQRSLLSV